MWPMARKRNETSISLCAPVMVLRSLRLRTDLSSTPVTSSTMVLERNCTLGWDMARSSMIRLDRAISHPNVQFLSSTMVEEVTGVEDKSVRSLKLRNTITGAQSEIDVSFLFLAIGHIPNAKMFHGQLDLDPDGYILTHGNVFPSHNGQPVPGVFACGDVQDRRYRQAVTAAGTGCMAALEVEK